MRYKDENWSLVGTPSLDSAQVAVLMDIRDELKALNRLLSCPRFVAIPEELRIIRLNTTKRRKRRRTS